MVIFKLSILSSWFLKILRIPKVCTSSEDLNPQLSNQVCHGRTLTPLKAFRGDAELGELWDKVEGSRERRSNLAQNTYCASS